MKSFRSTTVILGAVAAVVVSSGAAFAGTAPAPATGSRPAATAPAASTARQATPRHSQRHRRAETPAAPKKN